MLFTPTPHLGQSRKLAQVRAREAPAVGCKHPGDEQGVCVHSRCSSSAARTGGVSACRALGHVSVGSPPGGENYQLGWELSLAGPLATGMAQKH